MKKKKILLFDRRFISKSPSPLRSMPLITRSPSPPPVIIEKTTKSKIDNLLKMTIPPKKNDFVLKGEGSDENLKNLNLMKDVRNYSTMTEFFTKIYNDKNRMAKTCKIETLEKKDENMFKVEVPKKTIFAWNQEKEEENNKKFKANILEKVNKIKEISDILGGNCFDIIELMEKEEDEQKLIDKFSKDLHYKEFSQILKLRMTKIMSIFDSFINKKILKKEGDAYLEIGLFISENVNKMIQHFDNYFERHDETFSNMNIFKNRKVKIENEFYEALYCLIDYYSYFNHEKNLFGKEKPSKESLLYSISHYKKSFLREDINSKANTLFEDLENSLRDNLNKIFNFQDKISNIREENKKLSELYEEKTKLEKDKNYKTLIHKRENNFLNVEDNYNQNREASFDPILTKRRSSKAVVLGTAVDELYKNLLQTLEKEKKELQDNYNKLSIKSKKYKEKLDKLQNDYTSLKSRKLKETSEKSIECNFYKENFIEKNANKLIKIIQNPNKNIVFAFKQSKEWTVSVINLMMNERLIAEMQDEAEKRNKGNLQSYSVQWFLRRFGNKNLAEIFLKDFLLSLRTMSAKSERFRIISDLMNIDWNPLQEIIQANSSNNKFNKNIVKAKFYGTNEVCKIYLKIASFLQNFEVKFKEKSMIFPFLPNIFIKGHDLIPFEIAKSIMDTIINEEDFPRTKDYEKSLRNLLNTQNNGNDELYTDFVKNDDDNTVIRFDYFVRFILESIFENKISEIENIYTALKLKNSTKSDGLLTFDDFATSMCQLYPKKSMRWMERCYGVLVDGIKSEATPINLSLKGILPWIYNECSSEDSYWKSKNIFLNSPYNTYNNYINNNYTNQSFINETLEQEKISSNAIIVGLSTKKKSTASQKGKRTMNEKKNQTFDFNQFNTNFCEMFDCISSIALLEESYRIIKHVVTQSERNNPSLMVLHEEFKSEMLKIPSNILKMKTYEIFNNYDKKDLVYMTENIWKKFRNILCVCFNY